MSAELYSYESYHDKFRLGFELSWDDLKPEIQNDLLNRCKNQFHAADIAFKRIDALITCFREEDASHK